MIFCFSILSLLIIYKLFRHVKGRSFTVGSVYCITWLLFLGISSLGLYGLYIPSNTVYYIGFGGCFVFAIISLCFGRVNKNKQYKNVKKSSIKINTNLLVVLNLIVYICSINPLIVSIKNILAYGFGAIRGISSQSTNMVLAFQWIALPIFNCTMIFAAIITIRERRLQKLTWFAIADAVLYSIMYGGRFTILKLLFYFVAAALIEDASTIRGFIRKRKKLLLGVICGIILLSYLTSLRSLSNFNFMGNIIGYYSGSLVFLSKLLEYQNTELYFGQMTFGAPINLMKAALKVLFSIDYTGSDEIFQRWVGNANYLRIGEHTLYNAMPTWLYSFILDYGVSLCWIGVAVYAVFINYLEKRLYRSNTVFNEAIYIYFLFVAFDSILKNDFITPGAMMTIIILYVISKRSHFRMIVRRK